MVNCLPIEVGETYRSYKALCKKLNEPIKTGGAKNNQLEHWQTCFLWERQGNKFKITKIIKPLDQRPHKQRNESKWYNSGATILLNNIANTLTDDDNYNQLILISIEAYQTLGLCNGNFKNLKSAIFSDVPIELRMKFHQLASSKFYSIFNNILKSLKKQSIIDYVKTYRLVKAGEKKTRLATSEEHRVIYKITKELLAEYGYKNEYWLMRSHNNKDFYDKLRPLLEQEGFYYCYKVYCIGFAGNCLLDFNKYTDSPEAITSAELDINKKSYDYLISQSVIASYIGNGLRHEEYEAVLCCIYKLVDMTIILSD